jgi:hypothetical protein
MHLVSPWPGWRELNQLSERLDSLVAQLEGLGVARSADDIRAIADDLRGIPEDGLEAADGRVDLSIEKLAGISLRLVRGGLAHLAADVGRLIDELRRLRAPG